MVIDISRSHTRVVLFDPPDPVRLRYLTTTTLTSDPDTLSGLARQDEYGIGRRVQLVRIEQVIPLVRAEHQMLALL